MATELPDELLSPEIRERPGGLLSKIDPHLVIYHDPRSVHAEQYRACRTNLVALNRSGAPWAVVVTSSKKGEGKSVSAANLAACLAELNGQKVVLVDCDFRAPAQAAIFGQEPGDGVSELIADQASLPGIIRPTIVPNLDVIHTGAEPPSPSELLGSDRFASLVRELQRRYTWVILDTPPVNPYTDACTLSSCTTGCLIIVRIGETARELVERAVQSIKSAGGKVIGTFLTGLPPDRDDADRQGYYRVDGLEGEAAYLESERARARERAEKRLRKQERAYIKKLRKDERDDEEPLV